MVGARWRSADHADYAHLRDDLRTEPGDAARGRAPGWWIVAKSSVFEAFLADARRSADDAQTSADLRARAASLLRRTAEERPPPPPPPK